MVNLLPPYKPQTWKAIGIAVGLLAVLGFVLFAFDRCGSYFDNRDIEKRKAKIANTVAQIETKEAVIANLQTEIAVEKEQAKRDTLELLENVNATNEAKAETDKALANLDAARNANTTNSSLKELTDALDKLK